MCACVRKNMNLINLRVCLWFIVIRALCVFIGLSFMQQYFAVEMICAGMNCFYSVIHLHAYFKQKPEMLYWDQKRHTHIWIPYKSFTLDYCGFSSTRCLLSSSTNFPALQLRLQDTPFLTQALFRSLGAHFILVPVDLSPVPLLLASPWPFPGCRVCFVLSFRLAVMSHIRDGWFICRLSGHSHARPITSAFFKKKKF